MSEGETPKGPAQPELRVLAAMAPRCCYQFTVSRVKPVAGDFMVSNYRVTFLKVSDKNNLKSQIKTG